MRVPAAPLALPLLALLATGASCDDDSPPPVPPLVSSQPAHGTDGVPATVWIRLDFEAAVDSGSLPGFALRCAGDAPPFDADLLGERTVIINPRVELAAGADCELSWPGEPEGKRGIAFRISAPVEPAVVPYERSDAHQIAPFPDDYWRREDGDSAAGFSLELPVPSGDTDGAAVLAALQPIAAADGFSPLTPIVIPLPAALDAASLPRTTSESLDPLATVGLFDVDANGDGAGRRLPFFVSLRDEPDVDGSTVHHLLLFPAVPLRSQGTYVVVVTRRALATGQRPLSPSELMLAALGADAPDDAAAQRAHELLAEPLGVLEAYATPPVRRDDIALALRFTVRNTAGFTRDRLAIRERALALPAPTYTIESVAPSNRTGVAAIVTGTWQAPIWNDGLFLTRDSDGLPTPDGTRTVGFTLALPDSAVTGPVPLVMYQHGTPGKASSEVPWACALLAGGPVEFATAGFTDMLNRDSDGLMINQDMMQAIFEHGAFPSLAYDLAFVEQLSFLRLLDQLGSLDVLPLDAPDGVPDLDLSAPRMYLGVSQGSIHAVGLLPYAPEIRAASLTVGGGNYAGIITHQSDFVRERVLAAFPSLSVTELYVSFALLQIAVDPQEPIAHAPYLYQTPHDLGVPKRASVLMLEGLGDSYVPAWSTETAAYALGIPQVAPAYLEAPFLELAAQTPLVANIDAGTTAGLFQYVPADYPDAPATESCARADQAEGHFCPQISSEAILQRREFFTTALDGAPVIRDYAGSSAARTLPARIEPRAALAAPRDDAR